MIQKGNIIAFSTVVKMGSHRVMGSQAALTAPFSLYGNIAKKTSLP
jgi:hypothetical protein